MSQTTRKEAQESLKNDETLKVESKIIGGVIRDARKQSKREELPKGFAAKKAQSNRKF